MPISWSRRTRRLLAPVGLVHAAMPSLIANAREHAAMPSLIANAREQATWLWQSMHNHQMVL